jgi:ribosome-interacting GTPase 1
MHMPANLTPQYYSAEDKYKKATTPEDKMEALQEMLSIMPKHKGTEKLQADLKKRLSQMRDESLQKKKQKGGFNPFHVEKQGAGQVALAGCPNTGKSALVATLTRAKIKVADFPFTTSLPATGMMPYEDVMVQLVDTPPFTAEMIPPGLTGTFRNADAILIILDIGSGDCLEQLDTSLTILEERSIIDPEGENPVALPYLILGLKADLPDAEANLEILAELHPEIHIIPVSIHGDLEMLKETIYKMLDVIRIYGKSPGKKAEMERPFILKSGSNVVDLANLIHRDFPNRLKSAMVWGSARFDGQAVARDYVLHDKDIVELNV